MHTWSSPFWSLYILIEIVGPCQKAAMFYQSKKHKKSVLLCFATVVTSLS